MVSFRAVLAGLGLAAVAQLPSCLAYPTTNASLGHDLYYEDELIKRDDGEKPFWLRVMPLGASITAGTNGPPGNDKNGYRKFLRDELVSQKWKVNMVGTFISGTMNDNDHEGVAGDTVDMVAARAKNACHIWRPNVVLINAGTNDATGKQELVSTTGVRMQHLIDSVFSQVPDAVVVLSTLLPNTDGNGNTGPKQPNVEDINRQYRALVRQYVPDPNAKNPTFKVILADMVADNFINNDHIHDDVHPTEEGNKRMAAVWSYAINQAYELDWISEPSGSGEFDDDDTKAPTCRKKYGSGNDDPRAGRWILGAADSRIKSDGQYKHDGTLGSPKGTFEGTDEARIWMAQLFNHGLPKLQAVEEIVFVSGDNSARKIMWQKNNGGGSLEEAREITTIKDGCKTRGIHWGDVNGDGLDDFICIAKDGEMFVWINEASNGKDPTFSNLGSYKKPEMGLGQEHVRLGDIDGDGRLDYCVIKSDGYIHCWRNGGTGQKAEYWQDMGVGKPIFSPKGMGDIRGVRFVDINGDGRDDWVWVSKKGEVTTWINQRGNSKSMIPYWQVAEWNPTHAGVDEDVGDNREQIQFGRFFGSGKSDYLHYKRTAKVGGGRKLTWRIWENTGKGGGKYQKGDGAYWGDMTNNGVDDYIWISPEGLVTIFRNKNSQNSTDGYATGPWLPGMFGIDAKKDLGNVDVDDDIRRGMHIGDWDGDGFEDIIYADRATGALTVWINHWNGKDFGFVMRKIPNSGKCNLGWGLLYRDHAAHFADISGSGKVDYLCMDADGYTSAYIRDKETGVDDVGKGIGQVKFGEGWDRANLQFADADGDKRADLIWTDKFTGDGWVWYNKGPGTVETDNSAYRWEPRQKVYQGSSRGPNMHFPNLGGQGRADMVGINPTTGKGQAWFNSCPRGGDDPDTPNHEALPIYDPKPIDPPVEGGDHWFCDVKNSGWDAELWNEHGMGKWVLDRIDMYMGLDAEWPRPNDGIAEKDDVGIPRIIAAYDGLDRDALFEWHATCRSIKEQCSLTGSTVKVDGCKQHPQRAFTLWATSNLARFLQTWYDEIDSAATSSSLWTADISRKFLYYPESSDFSNAGAWLTVTAGVFASFGTFLPGLGAAASNGLAGISTIASGAAGFLPSAPPEDARFDTYADLSVGLGKFILEVGTAMTEYFNMLLRDTPPSDASDHDAQTLARLLDDGFWASMDADHVTPSPDLQPNLITQIRASMIAEAWNSVSVGIIKWSEDSEFSNVLGFNPCFGDKNMRGMDHAIACMNGVNYAITPMYFEDWDFNDREKIEQWVNVGQDNDTLSEYDLSQEKIIQAAERTQRVLNGYRVRDEDTLDKFITDAINNWGGSPDDEILTDRLRIFNVPVCELDYATTIPRPSGCNNMEDWGDIRWKKCAIAMMSTACSKLVLNGVPWPYDEGPKAMFP